MSKIYFDTTPIIYFLDDEKPLSDKMLAFICSHQNENDFYLTSTITDADVSMLMFLLFGIVFLLLAPPLPPNPPFAWRWWGSCAPPAAQTRE